MIINHYLTIVKHYLTIIKHYLTITNHFLININHWFTSAHDFLTLQGSNRDDPKPRLSQESAALGNGGESSMMSG